MDTADRAEEAPAPAEPAGAGKRRHGRLIVMSSALAVALAATSAFGIAASGATGSSAAAASAVVPQLHTALGRSGFGSGYDGYGTGSPGQGANSSATASTLASATTAQEVGVVDITSELTYDQAESAGTGLVLTSSGEILTNNHVVEGATSISVTVVSTGQAYTAVVVGTDATDDIAVLQLSNAAGLATASLDTTGDLAVGDAVTGVGNAGGTGGTPSASPGTVTALEQTITTQAEQTAASETLNGLIEMDADIQAGDSGGPLFDAQDQVVGIDTAAEQGGSTVAGYAIPIEDALGIVSQIESGQASSTVTIGYPAFLGVEVGAASAGSVYGSAGAAPTAGVTIAGVVDGGPAENAGIIAGDTITMLNGVAISSASGLTATLGALTPGQTVGISWTDTSGAARSADLTLTAGPAD